MTKLNLMDKYPIHTIEIPKDKTSFTNVDEIISYLESLVEKHPIAIKIAIFDHYAHTSSIEDCVLGEDIKAAKNLVFCFGKQLPNTKMLAVRPRSIGVGDLGDKFEVSFLEVPNEQLQKTTYEWVKSILDK